MNRAILSGRYDIVHPGHIKTIRAQADRFVTLRVLIADYAERVYPASWARDMIILCTRDLQVYVDITPVHFGYATRADIERLPDHDVFLVGNPKVYEHLKQFSDLITLEMIDECPGYSASSVKEKIRIYDYINQNRGSLYEIRP